MVDKKIASLDTKNHHFPKNCKKILQIIPAFFLITCFASSSNAFLPESENPDIQSRNEIMDNKIDPEIMAVLNILPELFAKTILDTTNIAEYRAVAAELGKLAIAENYDFCTVSKGKIEASDHNIPIYIYKPTDPIETPSPALIWIHVVFLVLEEMMLILSPMREL